LSLLELHSIGLWQGYVQEIRYQDGMPVKKGTPLFVVEQCGL